MASWTALYTGRICGPKWPGSLTFASIDWVFPQFQIVFPQKIVNNGTIPGNSVLNQRKKKKMGVFSRIRKLFAPQKKKKGPPPVDIIKRFEIHGKTGQGSMSKVFRARDSKLGRMVCLKILDKVKTAKFQGKFTSRNLPTEGVICMALRHKNLVQSFDFGTNTKGEQFVVMELIEGM